MEEDTSNPLGVACTERVEGGDRGTDGGKGEAKHQELALARGREQGREDVGDDLVGVAVEHSARVEADNGHTHWVDSSRMEGGHNFHIGNGEAEVHTLQADQVGNGVREGPVVVAQCDRMNSCYGDHTECDQRAVGSGMSGRPVVAAGAVGSGLVGLFQEGLVGR